MRDLRSYRSSRKEICLPAEEGGYLQHIAHLCDCLCLMSLMDVCDHRQTSCRFDIVQYPKPARERGAGAERSGGRRMDA